ncbi:hypothetical protein [Thermomonospora cellulosilytica]|uniref:Minor tail protein n=1 Tax=Thermomonospora cellulosilytica TaxID=1411118 RepID=A0A7W3MXP6_9ACTN|nr:hypothetical protein [Thermomonospora cellulosilytica]MBA9003727.1 hypothetical protein [Thermomonospora cellulosilytica]
MAVQYRYQFCDLLTDRPLADLPLTGVSFDRRIIQAGSFRGTIPVPNRRIAEEVRKVVPTGPGEIQTGPGRTVVHVHRNGALWGTYLIWQATPQADERGRISVEIQGAALESYLARREIRQDVTYSGADQTSGIAAGLVNHMQAVPSGNIGLTVVAAPSGVFRDRAYRRSEAGTYGQRLTELASVDGGFEWMIRTYISGGARIREFRTGYPRLGTDVPAADWTFAQPGSVLSWSYSADATAAATSYQARGDTTQDDAAADGEALMSAEAHADAYLDAGWPRLDATVDHSTVTEQDTLDAYARWWAATRPGVIRVPQVTVRLDEETPVDPNQLGRYAKITLVNDWFPLADGKPTFSQRWRVIGLEVTPEDRQGQERVKLLFAEGDDA